MAGKTDTPAKKYRSKFVRIAVEGGTTDGRQIERTWLEQMAASYDRNTYGARINCEHIKSLLPDSPFGAYGDVLALKTEEVEVDGKKKLALFAQLEPNEALIALNKKGQKIYTSMEVAEKFADTGKAYLVGLAITDNPASLGSEALQFSAQHGTMTSRKTNPDNLFTAAEQVEGLEFEEVQEQPGMFKELSDKVRALLSKSKETEGKDATNFAQLGEALEGLITFTTEQQEALAANGKQLDALETQFSELSTELTQLKETLGTTVDHSQQQRPAVSGGDGTVLAAY